MPKPAVVILLVCSVGLLAGLVGGVFALVVFLESVTKRADFSPVVVRLALSGAFLAGALILYAIKKSRAQFAYGLLEVAVGLVSNWLSLDSWFSPVLSPGTPNVIYARLAVLFAGVYIIVRGITNVVEGFDRFFPGIWPKLRAELAPTRLREVYVEGAYAPRVDIPKDELKFQIWSAEEQIAKREKKLAAAVDAGKNTKNIERQIDLLREQLRIATERYEKEILGRGPEKDTPGKA